MGPSDPYIHAVHGVLASGARTQPCFLQALLPLMPAWPRSVADLRTPYTWWSPGRNPSPQGALNSARERGLGSQDGDTCVIVKVVFPVRSATGGHGALKTFRDLHLTDPFPPSAGPRARQGL